MELFGNWGVQRGPSLGGWGISPSYKIPQDWGT